MRSSETLISIEYYCVEVRKDDLNTHSDIQLDCAPQNQICRVPVYGQRSYSRQTKEGAQRRKQPQQKDTHEGHLAAFSNLQRPK